MWATKAWRGSLLAAVQAARAAALLAVATRLAVAATVAMRRVRMASLAARPAALAVVPPLAAMAAALRRCHQRENRGRRADHLGSLRQLDAAGLSVVHAAAAARARGELRETRVLLSRWRRGRPSSSLVSRLGWTTSRNLGAVTERYLQPPRSRVTTTRAPRCADAAAPQLAQQREHLAQLWRHEKS